MQKQQNHPNTTTTTTSPRNTPHPTRSKSRILKQTTNKPIYLTDGQISSSDHTTTNISCSQISLIRIQYQSKLRKLQRENKQLKQIIVTLKAAQYYQLDQQRIKAIVRENQGMKINIVGLKNDIKLIDQELQKVLVQNQYLKKSNNALKKQLQVMVKDSVRQRHNYFYTNNNTNSNNNNNGPSSKKVNMPSSSSYSDNFQDDVYDQKMQSPRQHHMMQQKEQVSFILQQKKISENYQLLSSQKKYKQQQQRQRQRQLQRQREYKNIYQQQSIQINTGKPTNNKPPLKSRNRSRTNRSSSKSNQKLLINSIIGQRAISKRPTKKQSPIDIPSTAQSQTNTVKHYKSSTKLATSRQDMKSRQSYIPQTSRSPNPYDTTASNSNQGDYMRKKVETNVSGEYNEDYYVVKRQTANRVKRNVHFI